MRRFVTSLIFFLALTPSPARAQSPALALSGVHVVDTREGRIHTGMTMLLRGGEIVELGTPDSVTIPPDARVIDFGGKYAVPGLWDLHTHIQNEEELEVMFPLLIANGVLGIRDVGGLYPDQFDAFAAEQPYAPEVFAAGQIVSGRSVSTPEDAVAIVDTLAGRGVDFVKIISNLPREAFLTLASETQKRGLSVIGHVPTEVSALEASDKGLRTMEHLLEILLAASEREAEIRETRLQELGDSTSIGEYIIKLAFPPLDPLLQSWSEEKETALFNRLRRNQTWQVPTLALPKAWASVTEPSFWDNPSLQYIPMSWKESWRPSNHRWYQVVPAENLDFTQLQIERTLEVNLEIVARMHKAGVPLLTGTDVSQWNLMIPGESLHDEIELFTRAGLTPAEALRAATYSPAEYLGILSEFGTIERGKRASFTILDGNPLEDIQNIRGIRAVVLDGNLIDRGSLDDLLRESRERAKTF